MTLDLFDGAPRAAGDLDELKRSIARVWGFQELLPLQAEAMRAVLAGRDSLLVLPTGGGKSLCFQAPALAASGPAVVVSPLIALMKDQVDSLRAAGVSAAAYNSALPVEERRRVRDELLAGRLELLYLSPERIAGDSGDGFLELLDRARPAYFAIDEAHCISQWGHAFRPEYRQLAMLRGRFPDASVHAYTATATERVRRDIVDQLGLDDPEILVGEFDRPNLLYRVRRRGDLQAEIRRLLERHPGEAGIVYAISRREVDSLAAKLAERGHAAVPYHAGLDDDVRHANQEAFLSERAEIVVATVAFGMGIDRPDVRFVAHTGVPRSLEHYQQEAGRAGRDGLAAECLLLYSAGDFVTWRRLLESEGQFDDNARRLLSGIGAYARAMRCRHRILAEYFGQSYERPSCGACDWCLGENEAVEEPLVVAQKILSSVLRLEERWGIGRVVEVLRGSGSDRLAAAGHDRLSTFGLMSESSIGELRGYIEQLLEAGHLEQRGSRYPVLGVTAAGRELLRGEAECPLYRQHRPATSARKRRKKAEDGWEGVDPDLFEALRSLRLEIARERGVPPYVLFHDRTLREMARRRPRSPEALLELYGVGEAKAADPGPRFLELLAGWSPSGDEGDSG